MTSLATPPKLLPVEDAVDASGFIAAMLRKDASGTPPSDSHFGKSHDALWSELADGGWFLLGVPADAGGTGFGLVDLAVVAEAWGRYLVAEPVMQTLLIWRWLGGEPPEYARDRLTYRLPATMGSSTPLAPFGRLPSTRVVSGLDPFAVEDGPQADSRPCASKQVPQFAPSLPFGTVGPATSGLPEEATFEIAVLGAAELIGVGAQLLERCVAYAQDRVQFNQKIADFQAVQHLLADMYLDIEMARTAVVMAANGGDHAPRSIALAWDKIRHVCEAAIQVHGGFGFTWEAGLHFYSRHVWAWRDLLDACRIPRL